MHGDETARGRRPIRLNPSLIEFSVYTPELAPVFSRNAALREIPRSEFRLIALFGKKIMIHYHVWFNLKPGVNEAEGLNVVKSYLEQLSAAGESAGFQLLRNLGRPPRSKLPSYHALVEFPDSDALGAAMKKQAERGIHSGRHGQIVNAVCDFHVEIFTHLPVLQEAEALYACEI